ncbi:MAG: hypothetical protein ABSE73_17120 [Planctomycetota bacterium]
MAVHPLTRKRKLIVLLVVVVVLSATWFVANPPGRFGWCCFGYATYGAWPRVISDFQVRADGNVRKVEKTHQLSFERIEWLLDSNPEVLIIALGWDGVTTPDDRIREYKGCEVHILRNKEAIDLFNRLKHSGKRVAIHYHSTC